MERNIVQILYAKIEGEEERKELEEASDIFLDNFSIFFEDGSLNLDYLVFEKPINLRGRIAIYSRIEPIKSICSTKKINSRISDNEKGFYIKNLQGHRFYILKKFRSEYPDF